MSVTQVFQESAKNHNNELKLCWSHLKCIFPKSKSKSGRMYILNDVSGTAANNSFTAIMGPSGSGKTTFLEAIAQKIKGIKGKVTLNDIVITSDIMREISGFLYQDAFAKDSLTALEYLKFMSILKMNSIKSKEDYNNRMETLFQEYGLSACKNTRLLHLSGGEKRRLFLAAELLPDPLIVFCDEPTTGLDSYNALEVIKALQQIASNDKIVITSIHQPSSEVIQYFSHMVLLSRGTAVLQGTVAEIRSIFNDLQIECLPFYNVAEFYVEQISHVPGREDECTARIKLLREKYLELHPWNDDTKYYERIYTKSKYGLY